MIGGLFLKSFIEVITLIESVMGNIKRIRWTAQVRTRMCRTFC